MSTTALAFPQMHLEGLSFDVLRTDEDGTQWVEAVQVAQALGLDAANGSNAAQGLEPQTQRGLARKSTLGGEQTVTVVNREGVLAMAFRSRTPVGKDVRKKVLAGFWSAAGAATAPAAQSLSSEQRTDMRLRAASMEAEANLLRERRLLLGKPAAPPMRSKCGHTTDPARVRAKVLAAVREGTGVSKTMLYRVTKNNMRVDVLDALLVDLERDGMVTTQDRGAVRAEPAHAPVHLLLPRADGW